MVDADHPSTGHLPQGAPAGSTQNSEVPQPSLEELQALFMWDVGYTWQPADTAVESGIEGAGLLLPWAGGYPVTQAEPWLPMLPFSQQS